MAHGKHNSPSIIMGHQTKEVRDNEGNKGFGYTKQEAEANYRKDGGKQTVNWGDKKTK